MLSVLLAASLLSADTPLVFAHRGASGERPEHTMAAYALGLEHGADAIEPDLVITSDGHLVARHDLDLGQTTDVSRHFADRKETRTIDGHAVTGWFSDAFTLAELQTLRARQPRPDRSRAHDDRHAVPTWAELLAWAKAQPEVVPLVPELKHVTHLQQRGLDPIPPFLAAIEASGYPADQLWVQCFEVTPLQRLDAHSGLKLVQLIGHPDHTPADGGPAYGALVTPEGLKAVAQYADAIGVHKWMVQPPGPDGTYGPPTSLVQDAHAAGLQVHVYTFRDEASERLSADPTPTAELQRYYQLGVDAVFADYPKTAVAARAAR